MITVEQVARQLSLKTETHDARLDREITGGYVGDLLSCAMAKASKGSLWVTVQGHPNVVAVAALVGMAGVVITEGARIDPVTLERAEQEGIAVLSSLNTSFAVVSGLAALGVTAS